MEGDLDQHRVAAIGQPSFSHHGASLLGPISTTRRAELVLHGSPWLYMSSHCHQMITQRQPNGPQGLLRVTLKSRISSQPMPA